MIDEPGYLRVILRMPNSEEVMHVQTLFDTFGQTAQETAMMLKLYGDVSMRKMIDKALYTPTKDLFS